MAGKFAGDASSAAKSVKSSTSLGKVGGKQKQPGMWANMKHEWGGNFTRAEAMGHIPQQMAMGAAVGGVLGGATADPGESMGGRGVAGGMIGGAFGGLTGAANLMRAGAKGKIVNRVGGRQVDLGMADLVPGAQKTRLMAKKAAIRGKNAYKASTGGTRYDNMSATKKAAMHTAAETENKFRDIARNGLKTSTYGRAPEQALAHTPKRSAGYDKLQTNRYEGLFGVGGANDQRQAAKQANLTRGRAGNAKGAARAQRRAERLNSAPQGGIEVGYGDNINIRDTVQGSKTYGPQLGFPGMNTDSVAKPYKPKLSSGIGFMNHQQKKPVYKVNPKQGELF